MDNVTTREIVFAIMGSAGLIGGLITFASFVTSRIDQWRTRNQQKRLADISHSAELRKTEIDGNKELYDRYTRLLDAKDAEIKELKAELDEYEERPTDQKLIDEMYRTLRIIINEIEAMNLLFLDEEKTQIFARRFGAMHNAAKEMRDKLP